MRKWTIESVEVLHSHRILELQRQKLVSNEERRSVLVVEAPEWVNVIPLLDDERVVLIRQWRYGMQAPTLEIPGGMVDPGEEPRSAAGRELEEETGLRAGSLEPLGFTHPNPAFLANRLTTWLATDLSMPHPERTRFGIDGEEIERLVVPLEDIPGMIVAGRISHALVIAAFYLFDAITKLDGSGS